MWGLPMSPALSVGEALLWWEFYHLNFAQGGGCRPFATSPRPLASEHTAQFHENKKDNVLKKYWTLKIKNTYTLKASISQMTIFANEVKVSTPWHATGWAACSGCSHWRRGSNGPQRNNVGEATLGCPSSVSMAQTGGTLGWRWAQQAFIQQD